MKEKHIKSIFRKTEEELRLKSLVLDQIMDLVTITDLNGVILYINDATIKLLKRGKHEILGHSTEIYGEDIGREITQRQIIEKTLQAGSWRGEVMQIAADGSELILDSRTQVVHDENGAPLAICGISTNITEWKRFEKALIESELSYKSIFDYGSDAIYIQDKNGRFLDVNVASTKMYGYSRKEMVGYTPYKLSAPGRNDMKKTKDHVLKAFQGIPQRFEWWGKRKNGEVFPKEVVLNKGTYFGREVVIAMARDITEMRKVLDALRESEDKYRSLTSQLPLGVYRTTTDGQLVYSNPALLKMLNYDSLEDLLKLNVKQLYVHLADRERQLKESKIDAENIQSEFLLKKKSGELIWVRDNSRLIFDKNRNPKYFDGVLEDITSHKNEQRELIEAKEKAEESDRLKSVFLANVSHEIRTPMNAILGFLELLKDPALKGDAINDYVDIINQSGHRLLSTINDIIEISKIESGQSEIVYSEVYIPEVMQFHYDFFKQQSHEKGILFKVTEQIRSENALIKTDRHKLDGICTNLINNSIKFTQQGSIEFGNYIKDNSLVFFVRDTGSGIPADRFEAIFDRFVQADLKSSRPHEGSGLGLSIAKAYVKMLDGKIWLNSEVGKGSTFFFSIPYKQVKKISPTSVSAEVPLKSLQKDFTVLVAEDDLFCFKYLEIILKNENISFHHTTNGQDTVRALRENPEISLILMDIKMPDMDGLEATRQIRQFNKNIPIIAQTAYTLAGDKERTLEAGCNDYISKPINHIELKRILLKYSEGQT